MAWGVSRGSACGQAEDSAARGGERLEEGGAGLWQQCRVNVWDFLLGDVVCYWERFFRREHDDCERLQQDECCAVAGCGTVGEGRQGGAAACASAGRAGH